jgi:MFS family permease
VTAIDIASGRLSDSDHRVQLRRAVIASTVGTTIEWYDFLLYSVVTGLVFGKLFFPQSDPLVGVLEAFAVYTVRFIARPIGAVIFGHYGDRIGRKGALIATLLTTGLSTFAVGFVPGYATIGIWGAVILTIIRFIQGVGVGGEWGGSVLLAMEWARTNTHRGFIASWPQLGGPAGLLLANLAVLVFSAISGDQFLVWGWRIPFLLSIVMVGVGLYIRLGTLETPIFRRLVAEERIERAPALEVIKRQPKQIILAALARMGKQARRTSIWPSSLPTGRRYFPVNSAGYRRASLIYHNPALRASLGSVRSQAHILDRLSSDRDIWLHLLRNAEYDGPGLDFLGYCAVLYPARRDVWPAGALIAECFTPRLRYSGASIGYQLASVVAGGPAPLIATALLAATGSGYVIAGYIAFCAIVSIIATALLPDYINRDISREHA